jgi:CRP-like cAMP-binding protein
MRPPTEEEFAKILTTVSKHIRLNAEEQAFWRGQMRQRTIAKGGFLLSAGEVGLYQAYVLRGCLRSYYTDAQGKEHILQFAPEDWWTGDMASQLRGTPAVLSIDALEDTDVILFDGPGREQLLERVPKFERYFRILIQNAFIAQQRRTLSNLSKTAEERYAEFRKLYPSLDGRVAQKHIASYLGMTPEFLSTVRKRVLAKS